MKPDTIKKLIELNREFYQTFAGDFSATRQRLQPGVHKIIETLPDTVKIVDIGCGNGHLYRTLINNGFKGSYLGLDFSAGLLKTASRGSSNSILAGTTQKAHDILINSESCGVFLQADISCDDWEKDLPSQFFDFTFLFAVLHHIPGWEPREQILMAVHRLLKPGGTFYISNWQFLNSQKLGARIQPWQSVNLDDGDLDTGDYLLDWRAGGKGLRYVHQFNQDELTKLANASRFEILDTFFSDGEGANLSLYQTWRKCQD